jgi:pyruvate kinase
MRKTKILVTLGPVSANEAMFTQLVRAGVDGVRLSFSHGTQDQHRAEAALVRKVAAQEGRHIAILADLCGPKIRVG